MKIKEMSNEMLIQQQKKYLEKVRATDKKSNEYQLLYRKWFALRDAGEKRGLWNFIPSSKE